MNHECKQGHQSYAVSLLLGTLANINNTTQWQIVLYIILIKRQMLYFALFTYNVVKS